MGRPSLSAVSEHEEERQNAMSRLSLLSAAAALAAIVASFVVAASLTPTTAAPSLDSQEEAFVGLINQYRQQNGLGTLAIDPSIASASDWMGFDMGENNYFSHTDSLGRSPWQRMQDFGYDYNTWMGENIAAGAADAQVAFDLWRNSPGHNANMLNTNFKVMGIARAYTAGSSYGWYWVNDFGGYVVPPASTPAPSPTPSPTPGSPTDVDGDGYGNSVETFVGTNAGDLCGNPDTTKPGNPSLAWPADLYMGVSANKIDILDLGSFVAPLPRMNSSPGDPGYDVRWDLAPGAPGSLPDINLQDMATLILIAPPMLGGARAYNGPSCTP